MPRNEVVRAGAVEVRERAGNRVNQPILDRMVDLRQQGFSMKAIAADVGRSERTVRRYVQGVTPELHVDDQNAGVVDVFEWCAGELLRYKPKLNLTVRELDILIKKLRPALEAKDEWLLARMSENEALRREFLWKDFWPRVVSDLRTTRSIRKIMLEVGADEAELPD